MKDIVERLRAADIGWSGDAACVGADVADEGANEIERLRATAATAKSEGLKEAANWLRRQANAEKEPKARAAFIEAHNAILALAEGCA